MDSHRIDSVANSLGRLVSAWTKDDELRGLLRFNETEAGEQVFRMIQRGEISGLSPGYRVHEWRIEDSGGNEIDPESNAWSLDDLNFIAMRWELLETSVCAVPQDCCAVIGNGADRAFPIAPPDPLADTRERMIVRHRMMLRM